MPKYKLLTGSLKKGKKIVEFANKADKVTERPTVEMDAKEAQSLIASGVLETLADAKADAKVEKALTEAEKTAAEAAAKAAELAAKKGGK